mgnify:CR=1 FL=1
MSRISRTEARASRHVRIRQKIAGTAERPRLAVMISRRKIYVQFIDDEKCTTVAAVCTDPEHEKRNVISARILGQKAGRLALERGIKDVVVDRGGFRYHGRVKALVEGLIQSGVRAGESPRPRKDRVKKEVKEATEKPAAKGKVREKESKPLPKKEEK